MLCYSISSTSRDCLINVLLYTHHHKKEQGVSRPPQDTPRGVLHATAAGNTTVQGCYGVSFELAKHMGAVDNSITHHVRLFSKDFKEASTLFCNSINLLFSRSSADLFSNTHQIQPKLENPGSPSTFQSSPTNCAQVSKF